LLNSTSPKINSHSKTTVNMVALHLFDLCAQIDPHDWECSNCCLEQPSTSTPWCDEDDSLVCGECIASRFQFALDDATEWPARWGPDNLDVEHYRPALGDDLYNAYLAKAAVLALTQSSEPELPDGCTWGIQVQFCPGCKKIGGLEDGCNHIVCKACHTNFCFLCGKEARDHSGHWKQGGCPRYGTSDSARAIFDEPEDDLDDMPMMAPAAFFTPDESDAAERIAVHHWNAAMQTSPPATQQLLQRLVDPFGQDLTLLERQRAIAALGTNNPLTGITEADWHTPGVTMFNGVAHRAFIDDLLRGRAWDQEGTDPNAPRMENTDFFLDTGLEDSTLRVPLDRAFDLSIPESRNAAYSWMETSLHGPGRSMGVFPRQENSAVLSGISLEALEAFTVTIDRMNLRFDVEQITPTALVLTITKDSFGPVNSLVIPAGMGRTHYANTVEAFGEDLDVFFVV
jgi:hypothetical protein